jgi:hypothetical protein
MTHLFVVISFYCITPFVVVCLFDSLDGFARSTHGTGVQYTHVGFYLIHIHFSHFLPSLFLMPDNY